MEQRFRCSGSSEFNFLEEIGLGTGAYKDCSDYSSECSSNRHRDLLLAARERMRRIVERVCKSLSPRTPNTTEILYSYRLLSLFLSQQASQQKL